MSLCKLYSVETKNMKLPLVGLLVAVGTLRISSGHEEEAGGLRMHHDTSSSSSEEDNHLNLKYRRDMEGQEWQYEGLPIEVPFRRMAGTGNETEVTTTEIATTTTSTTTTSTTTEYTPIVSPPLDRRSRRVFQPDETSSIEEYPFMAALLMNQQLWCGAVIISRDKVLTAAHCLQLQYSNRLYREYMKMLAVRVGSSNATAGGELLRVTEVIFHPNYKAETLEFNFAVVKLHKNMTFGIDHPRAEAIAYSDAKVVPLDNKIQFLGWGSVLNPSGKGGQVLLQRVELPIYDIADCQNVYGRDLVTRNNFCAGYISVAKNVCNHDAGGPALMDGLLIGILSFSSKRCDQADQPAVFSTVGAVADWLDKLGEEKGRMVQLS